MRRSKKKVEIKITQVTTSHCGVNTHKFGHFINICVFIGPESDHWQPLSVTNSCLLNLIDVSLACEDANSKLVEVVTVTNVDD